MNHSRRNHKKIELTLIVRLSMLLVLMFGALGATQAQWSSSGGNTTTTDKVGIGTASPSNALQVNADGGGITLRKKSDANGNLYYDFMDYSGNEAAYLGYGGGTWNFYLTNFKDSDMYFYNDGDYRMTIQKDTGNVGVGTTSPSARLDVRTGDFTRIQAVGGAANGYGFMSTTNDANWSSYAEFGSFGPSYSASHFGQSVGNWSFFYSAGSSSNGLGIGTANAKPLVLGTSDAERMRIDSSGNVGIGTTSPNRTLQVVAPNAVGIMDSTKQYELYINQSSSLARIGPTYWTGGAFVPLTFWTSDTERMRIDTSGNVGIGTTSPTIYGGGLEVSRAGQAAVRVSDTAASGKGVEIGADAVGGFIQTVSAGADLRFFTGNAATQVMYLTSGGNVGIGISPGSYKLNVDGNINSTQTITANNIVAKYQDVAEWVPASEQLSAGTVVVLDSTKSNQVTSSSVSYDTRVAGVISEQPGIALGEKADGKVLVATTGRVRVKVDASRGPIHIGDLLVTSDVTGMAMKSEPIMIGGRKIHSPGTLIGKALEPLDKGTGTILVLLSLQ